MDVSGANGTVEATVEARPPARRRGGSRPRNPASTRRPPPFDGLAILNALPGPVLALDSEDRIAYVNSATEQFLEASATQLRSMRLAQLFSEDSPLFDLMHQVRSQQNTVCEYGVTLSTPRLGERVVTVEVAGLPEYDGWVVVRLQERSIASKINQHISHRSAARSLSAMAQMLAHEVKNPLSGIRGAAQLLEQTIGAGDRRLARLICDETDRICALVDRMEVFSDNRPIRRRSVNIHEVLEHVRRIAENGFGASVTLRERYDPSLPAVHGNRDLLVQIFLNLVKNACEAVPEQGGEVVLETAYHPGVRLVVPGHHRRTHLPLRVSVVDNGCGIPDDLRAQLFDPFVTTKSTGSGLGLAVVAKAVHDHGGVIEIESRRVGTAAHILLPIAESDAGEAT